MREGKESISKFDRKSISLKLHILSLISLNKGCGCVIVRKIDCLFADGFLASPHCVEYLLKIC